VARPAGPSGSDLLTGVRGRVADDLDTPGALAVVDTWAAEVRDRGGDDTTAPRRVRDAVDALLGVEL
jgi:L-cysteine:1D-myo-inositol 2-amino-2-deoxy-alpha-D-glucopyranoside ligase